MSYSKRYSSDEPNVRVDSSGGGYGGGGGGWFSQCWARTSAFCCEAIRDTRVIIGLVALLIFIVAFGFGFLAGFLSRRPTDQSSPQPPPAAKVIYSSIHSLFSLLLTKIPMCPPFCHRITTR